MLTTLLIRASLARILSSRDMNKIYALIRDCVIAESTNELFYNVAIEIWSKISISGLFEPFARELIKLANAQWNTPTEWINADFREELTPLQRYQALECLVIYDLGALYQSQHLPIYQDVLGGKDSSIEFWTSKDGIAASASIEHGDYSQAKRLLLQHFRAKTNVSRTDWIQHRLKELKQQQTV